MSNIISISRRQFLKWATASAAALGLSQTDLIKLEEALATTACGCDNFATSPAIAPHVLWFQGQSCGGCELTILNRMMINNEPIPELGVVKDIVDLLVGDAVGTLTTGAARPGWAPFPKGYITLDYLTTVMAGAGGQWQNGGAWTNSPNDIGSYIKCLVDAPNNTPFVLVVTGAIPALDRKFIGPTNRNLDGTFKAMPMCVVGSFDTGDGKGQVERSIVEVIDWLGPKANCLAILSYGTCSSWGGIPASHANVTQATSVYNYLVNIKARNVGGKIINIPGCAPHPDWLIYPTAWAYLYLLGLRPTLTPPLNTDLTNVCIWANSTTKKLFQVPRNTCRQIYTGDKGYSVFCDVCPKYHTSNLCTDLGGGQGNGDGTHQKEWCTRPQGCNGYTASPDCPTRNWNNFDDGTRNQWCVGNLPSGSNYVCQGCAEVDFPDGRSPFFEATKGYPWTWTP
jgi:Ni,Fe-hydrogenase I small subunit